MTTNTGELATERLPHQPSSQGRSAAIDLLPSCRIGQRRKYDPENWRLADYLRAHDEKLTDLNEVPLFLSTRGTPLTAKSFS